MKDNERSRKMYRGWEKPRSERVLRRMALELNNRLSTVSEKKAKRKLAIKYIEKKDKIVLSYGKQKIKVDFEEFLEFIHSDMKKAVSKICREIIINNSSRNKNRDKSHNPLHHGKDKEVSYLRASSDEVVEKEALNPYDSYLEHYFEMGIEHLLNRLNFCKE